MHNWMSVCAGVFVCWNLKYLRLTEINLFRSIFSENADADSIAWFNSSNSCRSYGGRRTRRCEQRMCIHSEHISWGGFSLAMPKYRQIVVHPHAWLSRTFRPIGMSEINGESTFHRQTNRLLGRDAFARRTPRCSPVDNKLFEKVSLS